MTVGIYGWFDKETGQCLYVGQSSNIEKRKKSHLKSLKSRKHSRKDFSEYYHQKDNKEDIYLKILEETKNDLKIKNAAEIKWFIELKPLFYGMKPDESYYCFTATEETKKLISKNIQNSNKEVSQVCTVCKTNLTFRQNGICIECKDKRNKEIIEEKKKQNLEKGIVISDEDVIKLYVNNKMSYREIAKEFGISCVTVRKIIKRNNITPRGNGSMSKTRREGIRKKRKDTCLYCGKEFHKGRNTRKFCSRECVDFAKKESGLKQRKISGTVDGDGLIPNTVKNNYRIYLDDETMRKSLPSHGKYHYGKDLYDYNCPMCRIDFPINAEDEQWKSQEYIADILGISKNQLGSFFVRNGYKTERGNITQKARKTSDLYCILGKKNTISSALWDINKITSLYKTVNHNDFR